jgi:hypothetical protein
MGTVMWRLTISVGEWVAYIGRGKRLIYLPSPHGQVPAGAKYMTMGNPLYLSIVMMKISARGHQLA